MVGFTNEFQKNQEIQLSALKNIELGRKPKLGSGTLFKNTVKAIMEDDPSITEEQASAIAASQGRKKYGAERFQKLAEQGRKK